MKICSLCKVNKPYSEFRPKKNYKNGYCWCRPCERQKYREYYQQNPETCRERAKTYVQNNQEKVSTRRRKYRESHKETLSVRRKEYYLRNKEQENRKHKEWFAGHPEKRREYEAARRILINVSGRERLDYALIKVRDVNCYLCHEPNGSTLEFDHVLPLSRGGRHSYDNVRAVHPFCNRSKKDKVIVYEGLQG